MFWRFNFPKKVFTKISLKFKLILGFAVIVLLMGGVCLGAVLTLRTSIAKLNKMVETTILTNNIINVTAKNPAIVQNYILYKEDTYIQEIDQTFSDIRLIFDKLKQYIEDDRGETSLGALESTVMVTYYDQINKIIKYFKDGKPGDAVELINLRNDVNKTYEYIKENAQEFIAIELDNYHEIKKEFDRYLFWTIIIIACTIFLVGTLSIIGGGIFTEKVVGVISQIATSAQQIADGNLQVQQVQVKSNDEIGVLVKAFNKMAANLRLLIGSILESSNKVSEAADFLKNSAEQSARASEQIASTIQQVSQGASEQSTESQKTVEVVNQLIEGNQLIADNAFRVLTTSETAINAALVGNDKVATLINQIQAIELEISSVQTATNSLKKHSAEISNILNVINEIATQTNLLALNASIEAARAGEMGKGFAVVAEEVSSLADGSTKATKDITGILQKIQHQSLQVLDQITTGVATVHEGTLVAAEARIAFEKIVNTSKDTDNQVKEITKEIQKMVEEIKRVEDMSENIAAIAEESSASSEEVAAATEEQTATLQEILASASMLATMSEDLQKMVQQFKL